MNDGYLMVRYIIYRSPFLLRVEGLVSILHYTNYHYVHSRSFTYAKIQIYILPSRPVCSRFTNSKHHHCTSSLKIGYHQRTPFTMQRSFMMITNNGLMVAKCVMIVLLKMSQNLASAASNRQAKIFWTYTDRNFVDNFLQVVIYLALVANIQHETWKKMSCK